MPETEAPRYEDDFYSWSLDQADKLRKLQNGSNEVHLDDLDIANLIEEVEDLARQQRRSLKILLSQIMIHMCVAAYATEEALEKNKKHWNREINNFRDQIVDLLNDNPGLKNSIEDLCREQWERTQDLASEKLADMSDMTPQEEQSILNTLLKLDCPHSNEVTGFDFQKHHKQFPKKPIRHYMQVDESAPRYPSFVAELFEDLHINSRNLPRDA